MIVSAFATIFAVATTSIWCAWYGGALFSRFLFDRSARKMTRLGLGFFLGIAVLCGTLRLLTACGIGFRLSVLMWFALSCGIACFAKRSSQSSIGDRWNARIATLLLALLFAFLTITAAFWIYEDGYSNDAPTQSSFGSIESGRYANIATYIMINDRIPILGQNYGQSILAALPTIIGGRAPVLALWLWLVSSLFSLSIGLFGMMRDIGQTTLASVTAIWVLLFCGSSLSFHHLVVVDSFTPLIFNGYADSFLGIGSFFVLLFLLSVHSADIRISWWIALWVCLLPLWCIAAPQNILAAPFVVAAWIIVRFLRNKDRFFWCLLKQASISASAFIGVCLLFSPLGGMLSPVLRQEVLLIPGVLSSAVAGKAKLAPGLYHLRIEEKSPVPAFTAIPPPEYPKDEPMLQKISFSLFQVMIGLRLVFYPVIGVLICGLVILRWRGDLNQSLLVWTIAAIFVAGLGFLIAFSIALGDFKWQLSRFMLPGLAMGLISFGMAMGGLIERKRGWLRISIVTIVLFCALAPITSLFYRARYNLPHFMDRFEQMATVEGMIGVAH